jgi:hypothetical protein
MGELALRSSRDPEIADLFGKTVDIWHRTMRGLIESASRDGSLSVRADPDAQATLVVSAVMGACMIPVNRSTRLAQTFRALESALGMGPPRSREAEPRSGRDRQEAGSYARNALRFV